MADINKQSQIRRTNFWPNNRVERREKNDFGEKFFFFQGDRTFLKKVNAGDFCQI